MERPAKIFLDAPVTIEGFTINYTVEGVEYMINHYEHVQSTSAHQKQSLEVKEHLIQVISKLKHFQFLYNSKMITL